MSDTAIITGITGQDGSYLCELLLDKGYKVYGLKRRGSSLNTSRLDHMYKDPHIDSKLELVYGDLSDYSSIANLVGDVKPQVLFHLGAMSHVRISEEIPEYTMDIDATGTVRVLEAIRKTSPKSRMITASSSEMFGKTPPKQDTNSRFAPRSIYAVAKVASYYAVINYRESYKLHASNSIAFNHDSKFRGENFFGRKCTIAAARIKLGLQEKLYLGNLESKRDISHASDVMDGMYKIIMADQPDDYVIASGEMHSMREIVSLIFSKLDMDYKEFVEFDPRYLRGSEVDALCGDSSKIRDELGWVPKFTFDDIITEMVDHDMMLARQELLLKENA